jgi:hypothetical protein
MKVVGNRNIVVVICHTMSVREVVRVCDSVGVRKISDVESTSVGVSPGRYTRSTCDKVVERASRTDGLGGIST